MGSSTWGKMNSQLATLELPSDSYAKQPRDLRLLAVFTAELQASFATFLSERDEILSSSLLESQDVPSCLFSDLHSDEPSK